MDTSTHLSQITMGIENLYPRWLFRNYGQFFDKPQQQTFTANPNATNSELDAKIIIKHTEDEVDDL